MIESIIKTIFWDSDSKKLKIYTKDLEVIRNLEKKLSHLKLEDIQKRNKEIIASFDGINIDSDEGSKALKEWLESIKHEAWALWLIACKLISGKDHHLENGKTLHWNMLPYDVQVIGGLALHDGNISEMKTWEWKTLVATFAAYLNALSWFPVHIVTVNDYLAERDAIEMWVLYNALWLSVWVVSHNQDRAAKKDAYAKNIVYATELLSLSPCLIMSQHKSMLLLQVWQKNYHQELTIK